MRPFAQIVFVIVLTFGLVVSVLHIEHQYAIAPQSTKSLAEPGELDRDLAAEEPAEKLAPEIVAAENRVDSRLPAARQVAGIADFSANGPKFDPTVHTPSGGDAAPNRLHAEPAARATAGGTASSSAPQQLAADPASAAAKPLAEAHLPLEVGGLRQPASLRTGGPLLAPDSASAQAIASPSADEAMKAVEPLELMRQLRSDDAGAKTAAHKELLRRGFTEVDFELARRLLDPEPLVRKQLAQAIPQLTSVDAVPWLMLLSRDPDPDVRMAAITTLATTGDPALLDRIENLARQDTDARIQELADHVAQQRNLAGSRGEPLTARAGAMRAAAPREDREKRRRDETYYSGKESLPLNLVKPFSK